MKRILTATLLAAVLAVPACGGGPDDGCASALLAVSLVSAALPTEVVPVAGVEELYDLVDLVVDGTITNVADGSVVSAGGKPFHHLLVTIAPSKVYKAPDNAFPDAVHLEFHRAVNVLASEFRAVIPDGTRGVLFGHLKPESDALTGPLFAPDPQGLFLGMDHSVLSGRVSLGVDQGMDGFTDLQAFKELPRPAAVPSPSPSQACN